VDLSWNRAALQRIREAAEQAKVELSSLNSTRIQVPYLSWDEGNRIDLDMALTRVRPENRQARADLLTQRGQYYLKLPNPNAAAADWQQALELWPDQITARRELIQLRLFGPQELRHAEQAAMLLFPLANRDQLEAADRLNLALSLLRSNRQAPALEHLQRLELPDSAMTNQRVLWLTRQYLLAEALARANRAKDGAAHFNAAEQEIARPEPVLAPDDQRRLSEIRRSARERIAPNSPAAP
jgi:hypothetical protein